MGFRCRGSIGAVSGLALLFGVPSLAQTTHDIGDPVAGVRTIAIGFWPSTEVTVGSSGGPNTASFHVTDELKPLVNRMWRTSPTFRRQCARLAAASVRVVVHVDITVLPKVNAVTEVEVRRGVVRAVRMRLGSLEPEYLAHELEHVIEQLDGVDLRSAVKDRMAGVMGKPSGAFETVRAIAIGRLVAQEVNSGR